MTICAVIQVVVDSFLDYVCMGFSDKISKQFIPTVCIMRVQMKTVRWKPSWKIKFCHSIYPQNQSFFDGGGAGEVSRLNCFNVWSEWRQSIAREDVSRNAADDPACHRVLEEFLGQESVAEYCLNIAVRTTPSPALHPPPPHCLHTLAPLQRLERLCGTCGGGAEAQDATGRGCAPPPGVAEVPGQGAGPARAQRGHSGRREYAGAGARDGVLDRGWTGRGWHRDGDPPCQTHYQIPILNLAGMDVCEVMDRLDRIAQTRDRRDVEQEIAISGGSADASPSVTPARQSATSGMRTGGWRRVLSRRGPMEDWLTRNLQRRT